MRLGNEGGEETGKIKRCVNLSNSRSEDSGTQHLIPQSLGRDKYCVPRIKKLWAVRRHEEKNVSDVYLRLTHFFFSNF